MVPNSTNDSTFAGLQVNQGVDKLSWDTEPLSLNTTSWEELVRTKTGIVFDQDGEAVENVGIAGDGSSGAKDGERKGGWRRWIWNRS